MEKAILKTLIYADIFDYPLKGWEVHKWLIGKSATLPQVEKTLKKLVVSRKVVNSKGYYCLKNREGIVKTRIRKEKQSKQYFKKAKMVGLLLKSSPWIKLVGVSGGLALENAGFGDDIDLFVITKKDRIWISRIFILALLAVLGLRRKKSHRRQQAAGKICLNLILEDERLEQGRKDLFVAHEVLQMKPIIQKENIYFKYLSDNAWVFKFLPNWVSPQKATIKKSQKKEQDYTVFTDILEKVVRFLQLRRIGKPQGKERIEEGALYFHPQDKRAEVLKDYKKRISSNHLTTLLVFGIIFNVSCSLF